MSAILISLLLGIFLCTLLIAVASIRYEAETKDNPNKKEDEWLFSDFGEKFYDAFLSETDPLNAIKQFGINPEAYINDCNLLRIEPNPKRLAAHCFFGLLFLGMCLIIIFVCFILNIPCNATVLFIAGLIVFVFSISYEKIMLNRKTEDLKYQIQCELPDFLDLLSTELSIGMPIENAMMVLAKKVDNQLSREFLDAMSRMQLGATNWLQAMEDVALRYDVEMLNDFVSKVSMAYSKGISVASTVEQEAKDIKNSHLLSVKERAGKMTNQILVPIAVLQFIPLLVFIMLPAMLQMKGF